MPAATTHCFSISSESSPAVTFCAILTVGWMVSASTWKDQMRVRAKPRKGISGVTDAVTWRSL
ncbi:MAG: hypothetical protein IPJ46_04350 [Anaerolineales bacterium]|nr:hypothetical protein [Anaerolineales bacterium]